MKLLHCADLHLDSPFGSVPTEQAAILKKALLEIPGKLSELARKEGCQIMVIAGDVFDGPYTPQSLNALRNALEDVGIPVFIAPGNHDYCGPDSPWDRENWPENLHIFKKSVMESVSLPELDCRVWGAGFTSMDCPPLLEGFRAEGPERFQIGVLHGDPTQAASPYCPVTAPQVQGSGLSYLALGHIHKGGAFRAGDTLCAWPGCPMGRGYDETGIKGALLVTLDAIAQASLAPLGTCRFFDPEVPVATDPESALASMLPPAGSEDFYRVTLTGEAKDVNIPRLLSRFSNVPNLLIRNRTTAPADLWAGAGEDSLEGVYFGMLRDAMEGQPPAVCRQLELAAKISRQILNGLEVELP